MTCHVMIVEDIDDANNYMKFLADENAHLSFFISYAEYRNRRAFVINTTEELDDNTRQCLFASVLEAHGIEENDDE